MKWATFKRLGTEKKLHYIDSRTFRGAGQVPARCISPVQISALHDLLARVAGLFVVRSFFAETKTQEGI